MKSVTVAATLAAILVVGLGGWFAYRNAHTERANRNRLVSDFVAVIPDSLGQDKLSEIETLIRIFWEHTDAGRVYPEDVAEVEGEMRRAIDGDYIGGRGLVVLMAKVGYYTYRGQKAFNLPEGEVDHPELNPSSALIPVQPDSATWAEFYEWKAQMIREGKIDSAGNYDPRVLWKK